jgi:hypothetical protein
MEISEHSYLNQESSYMSSMMHIKTMRSLHLLLVSTVARFYQEVTMVKSDFGMLVDKLGNYL